MVRKKHQPPAKKRYDDNHPIISVRVDLSLKQQLDEIKNMSGKSVGDILREALGLQAPSAKESFDNGIEVAEDMYKIIYKCSVCGGNEEVFGKIEKKAAAKLLTQAGWGHSTCLNKRQ